MPPRTPAASPVAGVPRSSACWASAAGTRWSIATTWWSNRAILERPMNVLTKPEDATAIVAELGRRAREAAVALRNASTETKNRALADAARLIRAEKTAILAANARDIEAARAAGMTSALQDRLLLND